VSNGTVEEFTIAVSDDAIRDLRDRLARTRWAEDFGNDDWRYGTNGTYLHELVDYWLDLYDWREHESAMNAYPQRRVIIDDIAVHFMHIKGRGRRRVPLVLTHGWPWSFWDFKDVLTPLSNPAAVGLDDALAFDLVVPSLPGYGFSSPLRRSGLSPQHVADLWCSLMVDVLGYDLFVAHGGDQGAIVTANLAHAHSDHLLGAHMSLPVVLGLDWGSNPAGKYVVGPEDYGPTEQGWFEGWTARLKSARAHSVVHRDAPQTLGYAFNDSPVGLAAWIIERRRAWSDCDGDIESVYSKDFLLTLVSIYWFTQTVHTSMRSYPALEAWAPRHDRRPTLQAPVGMAVFPKDLLLLPRTMMAEHANLVHWSVMPRGGHFAAAEQPELLAADIHAFVRGL
jgi:pimeloyl-ACP methyl ester carboxylesterase